MKLLALSFANHDIGFSYYDGEVLRYSKIERTLQKKHVGSIEFWFVRNQLRQQFGIDMEDVDEIVIDFEDLFRRQHDYGSENLAKIFYNGLTHFELDDHFKTRFSLPNKKMWFISHHYAHSLSGWMLCDKPDISIIMDGSGDHSSWSIYSDDMLIGRAEPHWHSIGRNMSGIGHLFGLPSPPNEPLDVAGKVMGLQSYGNIDKGFLQHLSQYGIDRVDNLFDTAEWYDYKGDPSLAQSTLLDWVRTLHERIGDLLVEFFGNYANKDDIIFYSGGVAQNVVWNTKLKKAFPKLIVPPHSIDDGLTLGGIEFLRRKNGLPKLNLPNFPYCQSDVAPKGEPSNETIEKVAKLLADGKVVGWYQGHGEIGPRALGNRSILMDPRLPKERINEIKRREKFRPFGASVLKEHVNEYFDLKWSDDYMLYTCNVLVDGLNAITHVDGTCRIQTVSDNNPSFRKLLEEFNRITGLPVLLNTSMNLAGSPIAAYPEIAKELLYVSNIDCVVIGDEIYDLTGQNNDDRFNKNLIYPTT